MKPKLMVAVKYFDEYYGKSDDNNHETMEIFETMSEAYKFASSVRFAGVFVADFNTNLIYKEDDGGWNYDDRKGLYGYMKNFNFSDLLKFVK